MLLTQLGYPSTDEEVAQRLGYWLPDPMSLVLVAVEDGRILGCLSLHAIPYLERAGRWARIESLVLDQSSRGRGTGRSLIAAAEDAARSWDRRAIEVTSLRTRAGAQAFYQRTGYADVCGKLRALREGNQSGRRPRSPLGVASSAPNGSRRPGQRAGSSALSRE